MDQKYEILLEKVRGFLHDGDGVALEQIVKSLHPADIVDMLEGLDDNECRTFFQVIPSDLAADIVQELGLEDQADLFDLIDANRSSEILKKMDSDDAVDLIGDLSEEKAEQLLDLMDTEGDELRELLQYEDDTSGGLMATEYVTVKASWTVNETFAELRRSGPEANSVYYVYVLDDDGRLVGVLSLRDLVIADLDAKVGSIANPNVVTVPVNADQEEVAQLFMKYRYLALPVIDAQNKLTGVITADDIIDVVEEEATEDIQKSAAIVPLERPYFATRLRELWRSRVVWLVVLFLAESITGGIMQKFSDAMQAFIELTFFIPLLIDCGGNAGSQSATIVIRGLAVRDIKIGDFLQVFVRELAVGLGLGVTMAAIAFFRAWSVGGNPALGIVVCLAVLAIVTMATVVGAMLPILATILKFDPAVMSSPLITTIVDGFGLMIYFSIAKVFLKI